MPSGTTVAAFAHNSSNTVVVAFTSSNIIYNSNITDILHAMIAHIAAAALQHFTTAR